MVQPIDSTMGGHKTVKTAEQYLACLHKCSQEDKKDKEMAIFFKYVRLLGRLEYAYNQLNKKEESCSHC